MIHWLTVGVPFLKQQNPWSEIPAGGHNRRRSRGVSVYVRVLRKPWNPTVIKRGERCAGVLTAVLPSPFKTLLLLHSPTAGRAVKTGFLGIHIHPPSHTHTHTHTHTANLLDIFVFTCDTTALFYIYFTTFLALFSTKHEVSCPDDVNVASWCTYMAHSTHLTLKQTMFL